MENVGWQRVKDIPGFLSDPIRLDENGMFPTVFYKKQEFQEDSLAQL